ncbi:MAG: NAD(P)-dependent oxidoreductase [Actinomycetota bacterium]|nr:NAD(P)-dependent oxidoreductase [Actinomycetota bacterium]
MKVLLAGATGAIGRPLVRILLEHGHDVIGTTRTEARAGALRELGAQAVLCDAFDRESVHRVVAMHQPEVIVNQLTALSAPFNPRRYIQWIEPTNQLRIEATRHLAEAGSAAGARLLISQSLAFAYRWDGDELKTEDDPLFDGGLGFERAVAALNELEQRTLGTPGLEGVVLRYGYFYGPGTSYARDGDVAELVRRRRFPVVGAGTGRFSFIHVEDAAAATLAAMQQHRPGVFNIVDDEPAEVREWLPYYAQVLGAKPPLRVPLWLARLATTRFVADGAVRLRGASNQRAKRDLGWQLRWPSWRRGFAEALG